MWHRNVVEPGKLPLLLCFLAFIVTFLITRTITRLIRAGKGPFRDIDHHGVHIHHSVPGLILLLFGAGLAIGAPPDVPWREIAAVLIGIGASLVLDEFALILHLEDVYWSAEGRQSVEAVALVGAFMVCFLIGLSPFGVDDATTAESTVRGLTSATLIASVLGVVVCAAKGKYRLALFAIFVPLIAVIGAVRMARPGSPWARRFYRGGRRYDEAVRRAQRFDARWDPRLRRIGDLIAGRPSQPA
ncbi:MAG TPA: hypothetical protein VF183_15320 [Acidimicrobiales bacterium]